MIKVSAAAAADDLGGGGGGGVGGVDSCLYMCLFSHLLAGYEVSGRRFAGRSSQHCLLPRRHVSAGKSP